MLVLRPSITQCSRLQQKLRTSCHFRLLHESRQWAGRAKRVKVPQPQPSKKPSLLEELFPEDVRKDGNPNPKLHDHGQETPRLTLPEFNDFLEGLDQESDSERPQPKMMTKLAAANAFRQQQLAVLSLETGSKSLVESDFRRIAPRGQHIDDWTGPGDILKVIPVRDPNTFEPAGRYFILFPNPAYARTFQGYVIRLHGIAKTYTPTSIESPLPLQPGVLIEGEDAYTLLQDYALCPPSQNIQLKLLFPLYSSGIKQLLDQRGYSPLLRKTDKASKSVLFSVDRQRWPTSVIRDAVAADGRDRGLAWDISIDRLDSLKVAAEDLEESTSTERDELAELGVRRRAPSRWIMSLPHENEARRFVRAWHRRPFPLARGDDPALVCAEFIW